MGQKAVGQLRHLLPHVRRSVRAAPRRLWQEGFGRHLVLRLPERRPVAVLRHLGEGPPLVAALVQHVLRRLPAEVQPVRRPGLPPPPGPGLREPLLRDLDEVVSGPSALGEAGSRTRGSWGASGSPAGADLLQESAPYRYAHRGLVRAIPPPVDASSLERADDRAASRAQRADTPPRLHLRGGVELWKPFRLRV